MSENMKTFLDRLPPDVRDIAVALRTIIRTLVPDAQETPLWGGISYHTPWIGGRVKGALCQIGAKHGEVRLEFIHGIRLADPAKLLCGTARSKRYVPISSVADANRPEIAALISYDLLVRICRFYDVWGWRVGDKQNRRIQRRSLYEARCLFNLTNPSMRRACILPDLK